ncbi:prepilin-type N-terminal cleavage/methylation domain-containing protein [Oceanisphaera sp. IT1-181]|uniref:prepilin-type N-terminal cleavage/methylation domain-containing protein n=1 Tax=Oceanisphaera sp. IT1-181 TaxID=3081199 RepID=UPI0029CA5D5C|nr:prepilin-type N-terminal cleavage/methylation domain-containing protein [Oceanisphaera sp. IT1-181]
MTSSTKGFTLLEMMIALVLMSLLSGLIFGGLRLASRAWETVNAHGALTSEMGQTYHALRNLLEQAESLDLWDPAENYLLSFQGTETELFFLAPLPLPLRSSAAVVGHTWFYLVLDETDPNQPRLQLKAQPFIENEADFSVNWQQLKGDFQTPGRVAPLLEMSADSLTISYQPREKDHPPSWQAQWLNENQLPELIRIQVGNSQQQQDWPPLVVTPRKNSYDIKETF